MHQASLYDHFPAGKEDLFVAMATCFERHQAGIQQAIEAAGDEFVTQLRAVADRFASQPPINLLGLIDADMPAPQPSPSGSSSRRWPINPCSPRSAKCLGGRKRMMKFAW